MTDGDRPRYVEVDVTGVDVVAPGSPDGEAFSTGTARRSAAVGGAGLVVGVVVGWLVAGGGDDPPSASPVDTSTPAIVSSTAATDAEPAAEPVETMPAPTTTRPSTTTTTSPAEVAEIEVHPLIAGTDVRLVGVRASSEIVDLDASTGEVSVVDLRGGMVDSEMLLVGSDWVVTMDPMSGSARVVVDDGSVTDADLGDVWSLLPIPGTDLFWRAVPTLDPSAGTRHEQVDLDGTPTGQVVSSQVGWPSGVDPAGGIVYVVQGRTYAVDELGPRLVADGEVLALTVDTAVLRVCDERLDCDLSVVDRATGDARTVEVDVGLDDAGAYFGRRSLDSMSPDGSSLLLASFTERGIELRLVDLRTGAERPVADGLVSPHAVWTPDGNAVLYVADQGVPMVYDPATDSSAPLADGQRHWQRVMIRP